MPLRDIPVNTETSLSAVFFFWGCSVLRGRIWFSWLRSDVPAPKAFSTETGQKVPWRQPLWSGQPSQFVSSASGLNKRPEHLWGERGEVGLKMVTPWKLPLNDCYVFLQGLKMVIFFLWPPKPKFWTLRLTLDLDKYFSIWRFFWDTWTAAHGVVGCWVDSGILS